MKRRQRGRTDLTSFFNNHVRIIQQVVLSTRASTHMIKRLGAMQRAWLKRSQLPKFIPIDLLMGTDQGFFLGLILDTSYHKNSWVLHISIGCARMMTETETHITGFCWLLSYSLLAASDQLCPFQARFQFLHLLLEIAHLRTQNHAVHISYSQSSYNSHIVL